MWTKTQFVDLNYFVKNYKIFKFSALLKILPMRCFIYAVITNYNQNQAYNVKNPHISNYFPSSSQRWEETEHMEN